MLDDSQKSSALEQVKRELRSILISSKPGVPLQQIEADYKMLSFNKLPFRDFGFKDVKSFIRSMPDVAQENRLPDGEIVYKAVCDDTTTHIQKLINNQKVSSRKKKGRFAIRGRGGYRGGRGSRGGFRGSRGFNHSSRGSFATSTKSHLAFVSRGGARGKGDSSWATRPQGSSGDVRNTLNPGWANNNIENTLSDKSDSEDWDKENQAYSPIALNLQIGVNKSGERTIAKQQDLREVLNARRYRHVSGRSDDSQPESTVKEEVSENTNSSNRHTPSRRGGMTRPSRGAFVQEVAPRFLRKQQENRYEEPPNSRQRSSTNQSPPLQETPTLYTTLSKNWLPPERGEEYLKAFHHYFVERNIPEPDIEVVEGKFMKRKGFYGRIMFQGKMFFPLEILQKEEEARQNAAKSFCLKYGISLLGEGLLVEQNKSEDTGQPVEKPTRVPRSPVSTPSTESIQSAPRDVYKDVKMKIYNIIGPQGVHIKYLPDLYKKTYNETLEQNIIDQIKEWTDIFNVEEPFQKRFIVYQVPDALKKISSSGSEKTIKDLSVQLPSVGTAFEAMYSFAESADEIYFHKAESADLVYNIEDGLANLCQASPLPDSNHLTEGSLIAANYEDAWYRARVIKQDGIKVSVFFIDYGNKEEVNVSDTRVLPDNELINNTPALAIPCMARKSRQEDWCPNVSEILSSVSETYPSLTVKVVHLAGSHCVIDLSLPDGRNVNSMLMKQPSDITSPQTLSPHVQTFSPQSYFTSPSSKADMQLISSSIKSQYSQRPESSKLFTEDPEPLRLPHSDSFAAYVCCVMSECSVILRIVDDEYSGKLDELEAMMVEQFDQWSQPTKIQPSNVYACVLSSEDDEGEDARSFYRVRVLKSNDKDGSYECYLLDHGQKEIVMKENIRHIDSELNKSLPYQAVYATLYGLDSLPSNHQVAATKILIHLTVSASVTFMAVRKDTKQASATDKKDFDPLVIERVRKILSCLADLDPSKVTNIYEDIFKCKLNDVEEIIKLIPGYGLWKQALEVELIDCSEDDDDTSINNTILTLLQEIAHLKMTGKDDIQALKDILGSDSSSQADTTDTGSIGDFSESGKVEDVNANTARCNMENAPDCTNASPSPCDISQNPSALGNQSKVLKCCPSIPPYIECDLTDFCAIYILRSESPSYFVAMPLEQKDELTMLEQEMNDYFSKAPKAALVFSKSCMYAVQRDGVWRRTLYVSELKHVHEVFYPDYHLYDTVTTEQLFVLPPQFYSLPLCARKMALGGVRPTSQDWSEAAKYWFIQNTQCKEMFALVMTVEELDITMASLTRDSISGKCVHLPTLLYAQLVDTSADQDIVVDQELCERGWARKVYF